MRKPARLHDLLRMTAVAAIMVSACGKKNESSDESKTARADKPSEARTKGGPKTTAVSESADPAMPATAEPTGEAFGGMGRGGGSASGAAGIGLGSKGSADMSAAPARVSGRRAKASSKPRMRDPGPGFEGEAPVDKMEMPLEPKKKRKPDVRPPERPTRRPGQLTAGEWSDLDNWPFWRALFVDHEQTRSRWKSMEQQWMFHTASRIPVRVVSSGNPVVDAKVSLVGRKGKTLWKARTDNRGRAELFAGLFEAAKGPYRVVAEAAGKTTSREDVTPDSKATPVELELAEGLGLSKTVDIMFVVDTTGSMGDELGYLKSELRNVIGRIKDTRGQELRVRTSVNFYRDTSDDYKVRPFAFTEKLDTVIRQIGDQSAGGGGDFPEAVDAALQDAVFKHDWSARARTRLLFLVLDAPPHEGSQVLDSLHKATAQAAELGIRIIPVSGSGIDKPTEFLMRFLAVATGGTYLFLTDDSGIGGSHLKPTIGPHDVLLLNDLLVKVINRYVATPQ